MATAPSAVRIRNYDVGFGDCFLLTFRYGPQKERHVLVDFGSFPKPKRKNAGDMIEIANHIAKTCGNKLHAVVATHRHADHINGFARKNGKASGDIIRALQPDVVIQPWTEHPKLGTQATGLGQFGVADHQQVVALRDVGRFLQAVASFARSAPRGWSRAIRTELAFLGELGIGNQSAVENLMTMAVAKKGQKYVRFGSPAGLGAVLPGVKVSVIGPPTIEQLADVQQQRRKDAAEFWHILAAAPPRAPKASSKGPFPARHAMKHVPGYARWLKRHADTMLQQQLLGIVRRMDGVLNNTSVILLFEVGKKKLLFPGDAQIENWSFALGQKPIQKRLAGVDVYKVGHHGSLNATPKASLWAKFSKKGKGLRTFLSTESGHHGSTRSKTEVPRRTLVDELTTHSHLTTTNLPAADRNDPKKVQREKTVSWVEDTITL
jgi:hypothetical protein